MAFGLSLCVGSLPYKGVGNTCCTSSQKAALITDIALLALLATTCVLTFLSLKGYPLGPLNALSSLGKYGLFALSVSFASLVVWDQVALTYAIRKAIRQIGGDEE